MFINSINHKLSLNMVRVQFDQAPQYLLHVSITPLIFHLSPGFQQDSPHMMKGFTRLF